MTQLVTSKIAQRTFVGWGLWPLLFCLVFYSPVYGAEIIVNNPLQSVRLSPNLSQYEDRDLTLSMTDARQLLAKGEFTSVTSQHLQLGYSDSAFWFHFNVRNLLPATTTSEAEDRFYLTLNYPLIDSVQFYLLRGDNTRVQIEGDVLPFDKRFFAVSDYVFPFALVKGEQAEIFLRVQSTSSLPLPLQLKTEKSFVNSQFLETLFDGVYVGISIGLGIYNLFLWLTIRGRAYGTYALMAFSIMMFNTGLAGLTFRFWPDSIHFQQINVYVFSFVAAVLIPLFGMDFLKTKESFPRFHPVLKGLVVINLAILPMLWWVTTTTAAKLTVVFTGITALSLISVAITRVINGYRPAIYYTLGQGALICSVIFTALTSQKVFPYYHLAPLVMKWSSAFELIFFSIGLADVVLTERRLREQAERESALAQQALLDAHIKRNQDLDILVQQRTHELETVNAQLRELNTQDELTGLHNRRYLNETLGGEYRRAMRDQKAISILMIDIDHFKQLNDNFSHQFGDHCLRVAGDILKQNTRRPPDIAARYGGEEFVVVLPQTTVENAVFVAEKIRNSFEQCPLEWHDQTARITVSIGVCGEIPSQVDHHEQLLSRADAMLYLAKAKGRNRVEVEINGKAARVEVDTVG